MPSADHHQRLRQDGLLRRHGGRCSAPGLSGVPVGFADTARRYVPQSESSLRRATVRHIEHALREFGTRLGQAHPGVDSCTESLIIMPFLS